MKTIGKVMKYFLPVTSATGIVCVTMHLTNQANASLNSLKPLNLDSKPDIKEEELEPIKKPEPVEPPTRPTDSDSENPPTIDSSPDIPSVAQPSNASQSENKNSSGERASTDQDIEEIIKQLVQEMHTKRTQWSSMKKSLGDFHEIFTRTSQLKEALEALSQLSKP